MELEEEMRELELYRWIRVPKSSLFFLRCDGWKFHRLSEQLKLEKPYDMRFARCMVNAVKAVFKSGLNPILAFTFSDEVSFLMRGEVFSGRVEKLNSIVPSLLSSSLAYALEQAFQAKARVAFDSRVVYTGLERAVDYLAWRQLEAWRNHLNSYAYHTLTSMGLSPREAAARLRGLRSEQIHELVYREAGVNLAKTPAWQRRGILVYWRWYTKTGVDPRTGEVREAKRRKLVENWRPPDFKRERSWVLALIAEAMERA